MDVYRDGEWLHSRIPKTLQGKRIDELLESVFKIPPNRWPRLFHEQRIWIDQRMIQVSEQDLLIKPGMRIRLRLLDEEEYGVEPEYLPEVDVVWEDEHCLVVNKPAGMLVHPDQPGREGTLDAAVAFHYLQQGLTTKVRHVHRLDRDTTGLVLFAKHAEAHRILDQQLAQKQVERRYWAVVQGDLKKLAGTIEQPIGRDKQDRKKRVVSKNGVRAVTHYRVLDTITYPGAGKMSLVEVQLETGRTHQIRVHFCYIGHPLVGDTLYGGQSIPLLGSGRQALHAFQLGYLHPYKDEQVICEVGWPVDLKRLVE